VHGDVAYTKAADGVPIPLRVSEWTGSTSGGEFETPVRDSERSVDFITFKREPTPVGAFTPAAYGLPELAYLTASRHTSPIFLWPICVGTSLLTLVLVVRWRISRLHPKGYEAHK
jgi:hypothetical protein